MNETASRWLTFAREDLQVAEVVLTEGIHNQVQPLPPDRQTSSRARSNDPAAEVADSSRCRHPVA